MVNAVLTAQLLMHELSCSRCHFRLALISDGIARQQRTANYLLAMLMAAYQGSVQDSKKTG